eukprot:6962084-Prymnesium_polylepis.1
MTVPRVKALEERPPALAVVLCCAPPHKSKSTHCESNWSTGPSGNFTRWYRSTAACRKMPAPSVDAFEIGPRSV